jgi:anion transporter
MAGHSEAVVTARAEERFSIRMLAGALLGPLVGLAMWFAPLPLEAPAHHALAVVAFMIVYWITEPIDHGMTALAGCYLFWVLHVASFSVAFSGFADSTPWFLLGAMLMGEAAARSGLARRIGYIVMRSIGVSYPRLLLSIIILVFILNFLVPSGMAQLAIVAPIVIGIVAAFGLEPLSNVGRGMFIILSYTCGLFNKMILAGGASILTAGIVRKVSGITIYWTQFLIAYLPAVLITIFACWGIVLWLYPPEKRELPGGRRFLQDALDKMGPWTADEKKTLFWLALVIALWATDKLHHVRPEVVALGGGLVLALPKLGVLGTRAIREVNFLLIIFLGGVLSMGEVLMHTKALDVISNAMMGWMTPLLGNSWYAASVLYWTAFAYHFILASELSMLSTSLPMIVHFAQAHGYNPVAFAMVWNFASGGKLFVYQSSVLILGYSYGYFEAKDLLRVGSWLTILEGLLLFVLVPLYWPLIGLHWLK